MSVFYPAGQRIMKPVFGAKLNRAHYLHSFIQKWYEFNGKSNLQFWDSKLELNLLSQNAGNPTLVPEGIYLNDNGHGATNDILKGNMSVSKYRSITFYFRLKLIGAPYANEYGAYLFGGNANQIHIRLDGSASPYLPRYTIGNWDGHSHTGIHTSGVTVGQEFSVAMIGDAASNTAKGYLNGEFIDLTKVSDGWAGNADSYPSEYILGSRDNTTWLAYYGADCVYIRAAIFNTALSTKQLLDLDNDPYYPWRHEPIELLTHEAAGPSMPIPVLMQQMDQFNGGAFL